MTLLPRTLLVLILLCSLLPLSVGAEPELGNEGTTDPFQAGILAFQNKNYQQAQAQFNTFLKLSPDNAAALTNLGLTAFQLGQKPWAAAYFRKALSISPGFPAAREGLRYVLAQFEVKEIPHQIENYEIIREFFLLPVSKLFFLWVTAGFLFLFLWSLLSYLGKRKRAFQEELPLPAPPWFSVVTGLLFVSTLTLAGLKIYDMQIPRATIVEEKVSAQSAPGENQLNLFDLYGGFEVVVRNYSGDWAQVTYPGAMTGWIKKDSMYITSGGASW
jgi:tetratricopeptide (TPR) repeat protein